MYIDDAVSKDCFYRLLEYQLKVWIIEVPVGIYIYRVNGPMEVTNQLGTGVAPNYGLLEGLRI